MTIRIVCALILFSSTVAMAETYRLSLEELRPTHMALPASHDYTVGESIASAGDFDGDGFVDIVIGVPDFSPEGLGASSRNGAVFLLFGSAIDPVDGAIDLLNDTSDMVQVIGRPGDHLGAAVAAVGDMNSDGFGDIGLGAPGIALGTIIYGDDEGARTVPMPDLTAVSSTVIQYTGASVHEAGDVNSDGYPDAIFGHPATEDDTPALPTEDSVGRVALVYGGDTNPARIDSREADAHVTPFRGIEGAHLGQSVTGAMIFNNDGFSDFAMLAPKGGPEQKGRAFLLPGKEDIVTSFEHAHVIGGAQRFVRSVGDINGDLFTDMVVGTGEEDAWLIWGSDSLPRSIDLHAQDEAAWGVRLWGAPVIEGIGDIDSDGFDDLAIGLPDEPVGDLERAGRVIVLFGADEWPAQVDIAKRFVGDTPAPSALLIDGIEAFGRFGAAIAFGGDMRGEGYSDFLVGAPSTSRTETSMQRIPGQVYVLRGELIHLFLQNPTLLSTM